MINKLIANIKKTFSGGSSFFHNENNKKASPEQ